MFYKARSQTDRQHVGHWLYFHQGDYYLYYLANAGANGTTFPWPARPTACIGRKSAGAVERPGRDLDGHGSTWKSPHFQKGRPVLHELLRVERAAANHLLRRVEGPRHWTRLGNEYEFVQDERWYERNGRWDCIWTIPRPGGGLYGYWTATPKAETGGRFGFGETLDGITWKALAPPKVSGVGEGEVGAIERIGRQVLHDVRHGRAW